ncbi:MAG: methyltransferase domain-containing protein [Micavibrio aeruginosavorus]|uniref:Methyltransferase domain-containing protein n=1 Tax=Micavibrio aeruginosavorus TaxID=349221 RepID=A0A7T5R1I6_9BACT|nr:MAG: methyltransferase domain-containing protein [Micavibrio aeruginosavorus]
MASHPLIFDRGRIRRQQQRTRNRIQDHNFLINWNLEAIIDRLGDIKRSFPRILLIGSRHDPILKKKLAQATRSELMIITDACHDDHISVRMDEEFICFAPSTFDLIVSPFSLHCVNDVPGTLIQMRRILKPDGLLLAAFPGGDSLIELRQSFMKAEISLRGGAQMRVHPFIDKQQAATLMQRAGYALPVVDAERLTVTYDNAFRLMQDLRGMGETRALHMGESGMTGKALMMTMARTYQNDFSENGGRVKATFEMVFLSGWAPHESQQQPLRPGSAQSRLAAALGTTEYGTGDIPRS